MIIEFHGYSRKEAKQIIRQLRKELAQNSHADEIVFEVIVGTAPVNIRGKPEKFVKFSSTPFPTPPPGISTEDEAAYNVGSEDYVRLLDAIARKAKTYALAKLEEWEEGGRNNRDDS